MTGATQTLAPSTIEEAAELMREAAANRTPLDFVGSGTKLGIGNPATASTTLSTGRLDAIMDYAPEDLVVTAQAGITLASLQAQLAPHAQRLALDPPNPGRATLGGLIATDDFGPRRGRYGSLRDLIIGVEIVRADGTRARGGGKVVKNVAGFDIPKLMVGSLGTLGLIASATFRLHPIPQDSRLVSLTVSDARRVRELMTAIVAAQLEPAVVLAMRDAESYSFVVVFEGFSAGVSEQVERFADLAKPFDAGVTAVSPEAREVVHDATLVARTSGALQIKLAWLPSQFEDVERHAIGPLARALGESAVVVYPALGCAFISGEPANDAAFEAVLAARAYVESREGSLVLRAAPAHARERIDPWGSLPSSFFLMERLKERFDPQRRLNRGRFVGGL